MSAWKSIYENFANGTVVMGSKSAVLEAAEASCPLAVKLFAVPNQNFIAATSQCVKVLYSATNVGCAYSGVATNDTATYFTYQPDIYFVSTMVNLEGPTVESRYFKGGDPVLPIPVTEIYYHTQWLTEIECVVSDQSMELAGIDQANA